MTLKATQQTVLDNLASLLTFATTGLRQVHKDAPDSISAVPCLVVFDDGFRPNRMQQWQKIEWRLRLQVFVQRGKLPTALKEVRDIRGDLIDRLDTDIALSLPDQIATAWDDDGLRLANLEYPPESGTFFVGLDGVYVVHISERTKTFT